ncbi:sigma-70 family RNA polymerase sigma factor [Deltaproteobacteria bacterium]|nr:sigma-70 family RNA polymerase sigma factor [Deltaproteobacteria bacterium]
MNKDIVNKNKDDEVLVEDFQSGNRVAFDKLVLKYKDRIFNLCYRFMGDYHESEDCSQDVFLKVYSSLKRFRFKSSFYTWLYRIAVNTCRNRLKSQGYRRMKKSVPLSNPEDGSKGHRVIEIGDEGRTPIAELEKKERIKMLQSAIDSLPADQKGVIILRDMEGLSYNEIKHITGYRLGTVKSKLSRARHDLRKRLGRII